MDAATILVVDDHPEMRAALCDAMRAAQPDFTVLEAADGAAALAEVRCRAPRLVLMDVSLPDANGIALAADFTRLFPEVAVIVVSQHPRAIYADRALAAGALAYVSKDRLHEELLPAVAGALAAGSVR